MRCEALGARKGREEQYQRAVTGDHEMPQAERLEHLDDTVQRRHFDDLNRALVHERAAGASAPRVTHWAQALGFVPAPGISPQIT